MEPWVEEMEGWDDRPFSGGYAGLRELATTDFSGAVSTGGTWLFMVSGQIVAVVENRQTNNGTVVTDADIERFEDAEGTVYAAPHPSVPLLVGMKTMDGETRGKYYTEKTPIDEVAATLEDGGFTGYVELSENVLSGDYYTVYQGGQSTDLAFIGNARRLLTDDDAHERMADEVGIYEVVAVDLDVIEVPGDVEEDEESGDATGRQEFETEAGGVVGGSATAGSGTVDGSSATVSQENEGATDEREMVSTTDTTEVGSGDRPMAGTRPDDESETDLPEEEPLDERQPLAEGSRRGNDERGEPATGAGTVSNNPESRGEPQSVTEQIATRAVPSVDPLQSGTGEDRKTESESDKVDADMAASPDATEEDSSPGVVHAADKDSNSQALDVLREEVRVAREELAVTKRERDDLAARVDELESRLEERDDGRATGGHSAGPSLDATEGYAGTNIFVRYGSKGQLTLDDAHRGDGGPDELRENLRLDHHTVFEEENATVDGQPFREWLEATQRFRFVDWLVTTLLFEIRETETIEAMRDLYDAVPELDRVEFDGSVAVTDNTGDDEVSFGLVGRNKMGDPLIVADFETGREPVDESAMANLVTDASTTAESHDTIAGAFYVTAAYYEPAALETAREATSGSLLSRDRRRSFVKLSRSTGYHLGLVESRDSSFHLSVPDL